MKMSYSSSIPISSAASIKKNIAIPSMQGISELGGLPLPELFSSHLFDMPLLSMGEGEVLLDASAASPTDSSSQGGSVVEEILDFFVDPSNPTQLLLSRQNVTSSLPPNPPLQSSALPVPGLRIGDDSSLRRKRPSSPTMFEEEDSRVVVKRERNRLAAERCRARRSRLITDLQSECDSLRADRDRLQQENRLLIEILSASGAEFSSIPFIRSQ